MKECHDLIDAFSSRSFSNNSRFQIVVAINGTFHYRIQFDTWYLTTAVTANF